MPGLRRRNKRIILIRVQINFHTQTASHFDWIKILKIKLGKQTTLSTDEFLINRISKIPRSLFRNKIWIRRVGFNKIVTGKNIVSISVELTAKICIHECWLLSQGDKDLVQSKAGTYFRVDRAVSFLISYCFRSGMRKVIKSIFIGANASGAKIILELHSRFV